ncbi:MAG: SIS domain-containing protein [Endomicrobium sp.]|jgi:D-sedoheptulose 7-phosphate isomerase|nr:SIS domain-containing protein [Endomicrobium sp.]
MKKMIKAIINRSINVKKKMLKKKQIDCIYNIAIKIVETYRNKKKTIICGNGGSNADASHFVAEMIVRFEKNRKALPSIALSENISTITAIGNDIGYDHSFSRQIEAFAEKGDVLIAMSTSGNSKNIIKALDCAKKLKMFIIGMTNITGGKMKNMCDICYCSPSSVTSTTQESHMLLIHIIANIVEEYIFFS